MSIVKEDLLSISPDALAPAATEAKAEAVGVTKASMGGAKVLLFAIIGKIKRYKVCIYGLYTLKSIYYEILAFNSLTSVSSILIFTE